MALMSHKLKDVQPRAALHDLVDSQHALLQQALASADPTLVVRQGSARRKIMKQPKQPTTALPVTRFFAFHVRVWQS